MNGHEIVQQGFRFFCDAGVAGPPIPRIDNALHIAFFFEMIHQAGNIRPAYQKQLAKLVKLHSLHRTVPQEHQYVQRGFGESVIGHIPGNQLMKLIIRIKKIERHLNRQQIESRIVRPRFPYALAIVGFAPVLRHTTWIRKI